MKKLLLALLILSLLPVAALAIDGYPYPGSEVSSWYWFEGAWVVSSEAANPNPMALARCFASLPADSSCNKNWRVDVTIHASIAQWINWSLTGTRWDWFVRKPGYYAADCITATVKSNQNVLVDYHDFGPLIAVDTAKAVMDTIPIFYTVGDYATGPPLMSDPRWVPAVGLNNAAEWDTIYDSATLHQGLQFKLWNYIHVVECNSACEYQDDAWISLELLCQKPWIDTETGYFKPRSD
jgi:hypothetical protein